MELRGKAFHLVGCYAALGRNLLHHREDVLRPGMPTNRQFHPRRVGQSSFSLFSKIVERLRREDLGISANV